jgi:hypothetical protein
VTLEEKVCKLRSALGQIQQITKETDKLW